VSDNPLAAPLQRSMALVKAVWMQSGEGNVVICSYVKRLSGEGNRWSGIVNWVYGAESEDHSTGTLSRDLEELRAEVEQLHQEVEFWRKGASTWRERALEYWDADEKEGGK
jgi:hypothetical protein